MFTSIYLRNYKTFTDTTIDLSSNSTKVNNLILLYGNNGIGKSNFASVFLNFAELIRTMDVRDMIQEFMENYQESPQNEKFIQLLKTRFKDIETIIKDSKTIGTIENMIMEFSFIIKGKKGKYFLEMDDKEIVHERLEYTLEKNKGVYFDITPTTKKLNEKVFINKSLLNDIEINVEKFWGKHSLLAIIYHEFSDKSSSFLRNAFSTHFMDCLNDFSLLSCRVKKSNSPEYGILGLTHPMLGDLESGTIKKDEITNLENAEKMLNVFLPKINSNIKNVYYKLKNQNKEIAYELYTKQIISGDLKDIPFTLESTGTHNILELLPFFMIAAQGYTAVIDEMDTGIHDLLVMYMLQDIFPDIKGQLIITTHNTLVMTSEFIPANSFYVIQEDEDGTREIKCITDIDGRVHPYHNKQLRYIVHKEYGAVPDKLNLSIKELAGILKSK